MEQSAAQAKTEPGEPVARKRRSKPAAASRLPLYAAGSELSVEERLARFSAETEQEVLGLRDLCAGMSLALQRERERLRQRDDSPERRRQDQLVGSLKLKADTVDRRLKRLQESLLERNGRLRIEVQVEKARMMVEREQRPKTSMHWLHVGGLITTPHQRRMQDSGAAAEADATKIVKLRAKTEPIS